MRNLIDLIHLCENDDVSGILPAQALASMLPDVRDAQVFGSALLKIEQGQGSTLLLSEIKELANAFISLIKMPDDKKDQVIQKMLPVHQVQQPATQVQQNPTGE